MTRELTGRGLDAACARAMGWTKPSTRGRCDRCGWSFSPVASTGGCTPTSCSFRTDREIVRADQPARYSTDAATLPEKLAWLSQRGRTTLDQHSEDDGWWARNRAQAVHPQSAHGSTIDEAVARLVVAVAEAEAGAKR